MAVLGSYEGSIASVPSIYAATVDALPGGPPLAHWRLDDPVGPVMTDRRGVRHGAYSGTVGPRISSLPHSSDAAVDFGGTSFASVPHDPGLALSAFSLLVWFRLNRIPDDGEFFSIIAKDRPGLNEGDFQIIMWDAGDGETYVQFQSASANHRIILTLQPHTTYCMVVRADGTGFDAYLNGHYLGKETGFTKAWATNSNDLLFAASQTHDDLADVIIDEVAIYPRVLTETEVLMLSQSAAAPIAADDSFVVTESTTAVLDVVNNDIFVGQKGDLIVQVVSPPTHGSATVRADNNIDFQAPAVTAEQVDSFTYRISDVNGTSNIATAGVTVQNNTSQGGGTLVYDWQPQASWIDGVPLANRDENDINNTTSWWVGTGSGGGASVGGNLVKAAFSPDGGVNWAYCWNRAPTGHPSLEVFVIPNGSAGSVIVSGGPQLYDEFQGSPRHVRVVMEIKTSKPSDPTTFKSQGKGPTSGSYTDWAATLGLPGQTGAACKYWIGIIAGDHDGPHGGCRANWWGDANHANSFPIDRMSARIQSGPSGKAFSSYVYDYGRPGPCGRAVSPSPNWKLTDPGILGVWHRVELEMKLADPETCPANAIHQNPAIEPSQTGNGFVRHYVTKDIDGELGAPGARTQILDLQGLLTFCRQSTLSIGKNNMHQLANILGPWINFYYGGSTGSQAAGWTWLRRIQLYVHD